MDPYRHDGSQLALLWDMRELFALTALVFVVAGAAVAGEPSSKPKQAMFKTQAEAEAAAPGFGCSGAHQMGEMWMVCDQHGSADGSSKH